MMASSISEAQAELISSLAPDDVPMKLRCAVCNKLAVNAFRLPCCDQSICENCQANLPASCPVCEHSPLSAEDCNPNKSLRTTIKVFLRTAEKKKEAAKAKEAEAQAEPETPVEPTPAPDSAVDVKETPDAALAGNVDEQVKQTDEGAQPEEATQTGGSAEQKYGEVADVQATNGDDGAHGDHQVAMTDADGQVQQTEDQADSQDGEKPQDGSEEQQGDEQVDDQNMMNGQQGMNFQDGQGQDFNQMQMMMAMQNGMNPNSFGGFNMMGMPGMGMDPMMMQNMYMNGGFNGMGMGGFSGGNNWNGQQWNSFDQNNFNQSGPMGAGDYGNFNSAFQTGYHNQGNYGHQQYAYRGRGGRGRGRGFYGGYGRGGYNQFGGHANYQEQQGFAQHGQHDSKVGEAKTLVAGEEAEGKEQNDVEPQAGEAQAQTENPAGAIPSVLSAPDVPINAPTGPKAMRQGLPNTSLHTLRARGLMDEQQQQQPPPHQPQSHHERSQTREASERPVSRSGSRDRSRSVDRRERHDDDRAQSHSREQSRSRSRSRGHRSSRRHRRHRSTSYDDEDDSSRRRKKHRSRKYDDEDEYSRSKEDKYTERSRSASPDDGKRSHRSSRRDRDRRSRDKDRDRDYDRKKSHRHRDRDYESSRRRDKDRERDRDRRDRKDRDRREKDHSTSTSRRESVDIQTPVEKEFKPPTGPRGGFDIKGSSARNQPQSKDTEASEDRRSSNSGAPAKDAHTLEREARDRERLLKEAQRLAGFQRGSKRGREDADDERSGRRRGRKSSRRDEEHEDVERA